MLGQHKVTIYFKSNPTPMVFHSPAAEDDRWIKALKNEFARYKSTQGYKDLGVAYPPSDLLDALGRLVYVVSSPEREIVLALADIAAISHEPPRVPEANGD